MVERRALLLALIVFVTFLPATDGAETITKPYIAGGATILGNGAGIVIHEWDVDDDGEPDVPAFGGAAFTPSKRYNNVIVSPQDDLFGTEGGLSACLWDPDDTEVIQEPYCTGTGCGIQTLLGSPFASDRLTTFIRMLVVTNDLDVCGGTSGTLTASFF